MSFKYSALGDLFEQHRRQLISFAFHRTSDWEAAAEIVQDVYLRLLKAGGTGRQEDDTKILYTSVKNAIIDHHRSRSSRARNLESVLPEQLGLRDVSSPEDYLTSRQTLSALDSALTELKPQARKIFILHRVDGVSNAEIAKQFDISVSAVEKQLSRVMRHCQKCLEEYID